MEVYLGVDVGSVSTKLALVDDSGQAAASVYLPTAGNPIYAVQGGLREMERRMPDGAGIKGVAATGSARYLAGVLLDADLVKNEVTCHAAASLNYCPEARTVLEIGGQDSKIIIIREGLVADFALNTVCAAGTGSFLDHQAARLGMTIEEFAAAAVASRRPAPLSGRCTVFAESDMVNKQQMGHRKEDIIHGLCRTLVRNFLSDVAAGKDIQAPVLFQGGVAHNRGMVRAFSEEIGLAVAVPPHPEMMGAVGAALLVREEMLASARGTGFKGFEAALGDYHTSSFECRKCARACEVAQVISGGRVISRWGGRCDLWEESRRETRGVNDNCR